DPAAPSTFHAALIKDVLIVGNDLDLVSASARLAKGTEAGALPDRADASEIFAAEDSPLRLFVDVETAAVDMEESEGTTPGEWLRSHDGMTGLLGFLIDPDLLATAGVKITFPEDEHCRLDVQGVRSDGSYSEAAAAMVDFVPRSGGEALAEAAALAPAGSAVLAARVELPAGTMVRLLYGRASAEIRKAVDEGLVEARTSIDDIARDADDLLLPGVSLVLERLPDCDSIALDTYGADAEGKFILPLPGVLMALRLRDDVSTEQAESFLRRIKDWVPLRTFADLRDLPPGTTGFRAEPKFLTQDKTLVKPAAAFSGDLVLLASNEGTLRRALAARDGEQANFNDMEAFWAGAGLPGEGQLHVLVDGEALLRMLRDDRREVATERVNINWKTERSRIHRDVVLEVMKNRQVIVQREIVKIVDRRVEQRRQVQRDVEFPEAVSEYLDELRRWEVLRSVGVALAWDDAGARVGVVLRTED
ncbi:MAG: hypothetical protein ACYTG4_14565, partial [Planctomycetota bacterium]